MKVKVNTIQTERIDTRTIITTSSGCIAARSCPEEGGVGANTVVLGSNRWVRMETYSRCACVTCSMAQQMVPPDLQHLPLVLRQTPHWAVWRYEENSEKRKLDKVPYNPRSPSEQPWHASVSKPRSWGSFSEAVRALSSGRYTGVGFVFHDSDPFCGIDLDHCLDMERQDLNAWAQEIIAQIGSYSEWSPSGSGIHILTEASLPVSGINRKGVGLEMYGAGRFFTMTGKHVAGSPEDVLPRQEAVMALYSAYALAEYTHTDQGTTDPNREPVTQTTSGPSVSTSTQKTGRGRTFTTPDNLSDEELLEKAMNQERDDGRDFARLWHGDKSGYVHRYGDQKGQIDDSLADYALCRMLAFWTARNAARMDQLFRQSGLIRQKWNTSSGGSGTYGQRTIDRAIANCRRTYDPSWKPKQTGNKDERPSQNRTSKEDV